MGGANLGDSGFRVVRDGRVVLASPVQCHKFNTPFQLSWPEFNESNFPEESDEFDVILAPGDVVVLGTDGLFDNFFDDDIARVVRDAGGGAAAIASDLAAEASSKSKDEGYLSPFILDAIDAGYSQDLRGGKLDDITVLVACVGKAEGGGAAGGAGGDVFWEPPSSTTKVKVDGAGLAAADAQAQLLAAAGGNGRGSAEDVIAEAEGGGGGAAGGEEAPEDGAEDGAGGDKREGEEGDDEDDGPSSTTYQFN